MTCNYQGYEFGAGYLDSYCVDGRLYDADDEYEPLDHRPCPQCQPLAAMHSYADSWVGTDAKWPRYSAWHLVMDIRRNRDLRTTPLVAWLAVRLWHELMGRRWWRVKLWFSRLARKEPPHAR